jgi:hypothetical protein
LNKQLNQAKKQASKQNQRKRRRWSSERNRKREEEIRDEGSSSLAVSNGALATSNYGTGIILGRGPISLVSRDQALMDGRGEGRGGSPPLVFRGTPSDAPGEVLGCDHLRWF